MGIRFSCPNGHKLNVKTFLAGKRGVCPQCGAKFIIPMATDSAEPEASQSGGVAQQAHSVEIITNAPSTVTSAAASPSIVIATSELAATPQQVEPEPAIPTPEAAPSIPPAATSGDQPLIVTEPVAAPPAEPAFIIRRERNRRKQVTASVVLLLLVIVLAIVLVWVLRRDGSNPAAEKVSAAGLGNLADNFVARANLRIPLQ
jgi:hypothetical protein